MSTVEDDLRLAKRRLVLRDSLVFFSLTVISVVLFALTWGIFSSFSEHRVELAQRWYTRGQADLAANHPEKAVTSLRAALSYAPENHEYQLLLAEALTRTGVDDDEAMAYFSNLWEAEPGSGPLNLQLARLSVHKKQKADAIRYYHASIYGTWEGDGTERRREVRLELIRFLLSNGNLRTAQDELLIAAGNASDDPVARLGIAKLMAQAGDPNSAMTQFQRLLAADPANLDARQGAAEIAFQLGQYGTVVKLLRAEPVVRDISSQTLFEQATRILALNPAESLPDGERVARILRLRQIVESRWNACQAKLAASGPLPTEPQALANAWKSDDLKTLRSSLPHDSDRQQQEVKFIYRTELLADRLCGAPVGDDELVALLAKSFVAVQQ